MKTILNAKLSVLIFFSGIFASEMSFAADSFPAQARLFVAYPKISPDNINADLTAAGLKTFKNMLHGGLEITTPVFSILNVGLRYSPRLAYAVENPDNAVTDYYGGLVQQVMFGVVRVHALKTAAIRLDAFAGIGASNSGFEMKTASQNGSLAPASIADWFSPPMYTYGVSAGVGYKKFFFYVEGAYEQNKISALQAKGTISSTATSIDLSGYYVAIGLMFDGVTATKQ